MAVAVGLGKFASHGDRFQEEAPRAKLSNPGRRLLCRGLSRHRVKGRGIGPRGSRDLVDGTHRHAPQVFGSEPTWADHVSAWR